MCFICCYFLFYKFIRRKLREFNCFVSEVSEDMEATSIDYHLAFLCYTFYY